MGWIFEFQTATIVLEEHCERAVLRLSVGQRKKGPQGGRMRVVSKHVPPITVRRHPSHDVTAQLLGRNRRIVEKTKLVVVSAVQIEQMLFLRFRQAQRKTYSFQDPPRCSVELPVEVSHERAEARQDLFREPYVPLRCVVLAANLVAFLSLILDQVRTASEPCSFLRDSYFEILNLSKRTAPRLDNLPAVPLRVRVNLLQARMRVAS